MELRYPIIATIILYIICKISEKILLIRVADKIDAYRHLMMNAKNILEMLQELDEAGKLGLVKDGSFVAILKYYNLELEGSVTTIHIVNDLLAKGGLIPAVKANNVLKLRTEHLVRVVEKMKEVVEKTLERNRSRVF